MNLIIIGLALDLVGVFFLLMASLFGHHYSKYPQEKLSKRYSYMWFTRDKREGKPPFRRVSRQGPFSPSHYMNMLGFLSIIIGFALQIKGQS